MVGTSMSDSSSTSAVPELSGCVALTLALSLPSFAQRGGFAIASKRPFQEIARIEANSAKFFKKRNR